MTEVPNPQYQDEIDFTKLVLSIWDGKWLIILITTIFVFLGSVFYYLNRDLYNVDIVLRPMGLSDFEAYSSFNNTLDYLEKEKAVEINNNIHVYSHKFETDFWDIISQRETLVQALDESRVTEQKNEETDADYFARLQVQGKGFIFFDKTFKIMGDELIEDKPNKIKFVLAQGPEEITSFIDKWFSLTSDQVKKLYASRYESYVNSYKQLNSWEKRDLAMKKADLLATYELEKSQKIEYLKEQAEIARSLGIQENAWAAKKGQNQDQFKDQQFSLVLDNRQLYYMRGFGAIEREIDLIEGRQDITQHVPAFVEIENRLRELENDETLQRLNLIYQATPLNSETFSPISKGETTTKISKKYNLVVIVLISGILGGVLGLMTLILRNAIQSRPQA
ncbi:MAG: Wzz/FepE/Etk N-terminal domain-containing protein [Parvibaculales bacterium]